MTTYNKATLKTFFEQGDVPTGTNYSDFIDSYVNLVETGQQTMAGPLYTTELITPRVSSNNATFGGTNFGVVLTGSFNVSAANSVALYADNNVTLDASQSSISMGASVIINAEGNNITLNAATTVTVSAGSNINLNSQVVASALRVTTITSSNKIYAQEGYHNTPAIVSAAGTTQGAATVVSAPMARLRGVTDGAATGFALMANRTGLVQYLFNEQAVSANLWPPTGGTINGLSANQPFPMASTTMYTVLHTQASAYAVK